VENDHHGIDHPRDVALRDQAVGRETGESENRLPPYGF
jgi:hypothetical protein